jgi:hypothetical protein
MKRLFGNGRPIAIAVFALGVIAIAVPAFGASGGASGSGGSAGGNAAPHGGQLPPLPPPPALSGAMRKKLDKTAQCMRSHAADIPGAKSSAHGFFIGPDVPRKALAQAAKDCGAPPPPPRGAMLPPPMGAPGDRGKFSAAVGRCLHAQSQRRQK